MYFPFKQGEEEMDAEAVKGEQDTEQENHDRASMKDSTEIEDENLT